MTTHAICINNEGYTTSLDVLKVYAVLPPEPGDDDLEAVRVVDESGEDYLYPREYFEPVAVSETVAALVEQQR